MLSFRPFGRRGVVKISKARAVASTFLKNFTFSQNPLFVFGRHDFSRAGTRADSHQADA
jgi:hypothetical protein